MRITAAVALLTTLALAGAGAIVYLIERGKVDDANQAVIQQEFEEFAELQANGVDADTGEPFGDIEALITTYMRRNVPAEEELLVGWWDDGPRVQLPTWDVVTRSDEFKAAVAPLVDTNGSTSIDTEFGTLLIDVQSVQQGVDRGAFVVVTFQDDTYAGLHDTMRTYATVSALALLLVTGFAAWQSGRLLAPLRTLRETADEITDTDLSRRLPVTGNDDITALTHTVNRMLDRLESAFVGQRQFLDDAGHELKTPLTVLRGHLELLDIGSPEEIAETRELLLDEVDRMSRLVGDLILLAKSDRPDFVSLRPVDLTGLTIDVLAKARGPRRPPLDAGRDRVGDRNRGRAAADPGAAPALRQRGEAHRSRRRGRPGVVVRRHPRASVGARQRSGRAGRRPRPDLREVRPQHRARRGRGVRSGPLDRAGHRTGARGSGNAGGRRAARRAVHAGHPAGRHLRSRRRRTDETMPIRQQVDDRTEELPIWHGS